MYKENYPIAFLL